MKINFNDNWVFIDTDKDIEDIEDIDYSLAEKIELPHTFNGEDGQNAETKHKRAWYKKCFADPRPETDKVVYLDFAGVNSIAEVYLNGKRMCEHKGGYSRFRCEITDYLLPENTLLVSVSNIICDEVYPAVADFTFYGGIYRDVNLLLLNQTHFDLDYYGGSGIKLDADGEGNVTVTTYQNGGEAKVRVYNADGALVASGKSGELLKVKNPILWDGVKSPYLYTAEAILYDNGFECDRVTEKFGFRSFYIDPNRGFFLNGKPYQLRGASRHQDRPIIGNAISREHHEEDVALLLEMGASALRVAHYQQDDYLYELCDRYGLVVWSEIPYISKHSDAGKENALQQMKELIVQTYNHPCIVCRAISNEITMVKSDGELLLQTHKELADVCRQMDKGRFVTLALYAVGNNPPIIDCVDAVGHNLYGGWYGFSGISWNGKRIDSFHKRYPNIPMGFSEYGADAIIGIHAAHPKKGDNSEEYQCYLHEKMLNIIEKRPYIWCVFPWNMFDFAADRRKRGLDKGKNHKGFVSFDRKTKKDVFYLYKAHWSDEPFVHICGKGFEYRSGRKIKIKVYSNKDDVSLYANGRLIETKRAEKVFTFTIKNENVNEIKAVSGYCEDYASFYKGKRNYSAKATERRSWENIK